MDIDVSGWILEFLLRQNSVDDRSLNNLIRVLPLPDNNPRLKKSLILRKIESDIEKGTVSERTFEFLEGIEELDVKEGNVEVSEAKKVAYCTVAMHCIAKFIEESAGDNKEEHARALVRIWSGRMRKMERPEVAKRVGLVQDDFLRWMDDIETGGLDVDVCENILARVKGLDVLEVLRCYVNEAKEKMGPSFLELACETILNDDALSKMMGLDEGSELNDQIKDGAPTVAPAVRQDVDANVNTNGKGSEALRVHVLPRHKHVTTKCRGSGRGTHRGAKIVDPMETFCNRYDSIPTPQVNKVQKDLETSSFELHAVVQDPLMDALRLAESFKTSTSGANMAQKHVVGNLNRLNGEAPSSSHDRNSKAPEANGDDGFCRDQKERPKSSLMERNRTAHTLEWSDSIDSGSKEEGSPTRPHLPSPKKRAVSPLRIYKIEKLARKRKKKRWTTIEEDTLRTGVQKYGKGNWKLILSMYRDIFEDRTEVDLKDKWRNLIR